MPATFAPLGAFRAADDLWTRLHRNFSRLEEEKYLPRNVFQRAKEHDKWPGDTEGRTLLAWILLARATGRAPRYLDTVLDAWPAEVNARGYFGRVHTEGISEQQLSSHGWVLRALAELERWRPGGPARALAAPVWENLFLPTAGRYAAYPISPADRDATGAHSGMHQKRIGDWILSSDIACFAIGLDGLVDAFAVFGDARLVPLVDEMIARFLEIDLAAIRAQTHATLTACRALLHWAELRGRPELVDAAAARFRLYAELAWTETHANYNWFGRPTWTEPCAIVDSLIVAMELWRRLRDDAFLEHAQLIWFNALGSAQRVNGGFGCDTCPGADASPDLAFSVFEAHWCCTMRGGEGLARLTQYQAVRDGAALLLPFLLSGDYAEPDRALRVSLVSRYPLAAEADIVIHGAGADADSNMALREIRVFVPSWLEEARVVGADGGPVKFRREGRWLVLPLDDAKERRVRLAGRLLSRERPLLGATTTYLAAAPAAAEKLAGAAMVFQRGPLLLADKPGEPTPAICADPAHLQPIFAAYLDGVTEKSRSARRLLFCRAV